MKITLPQQRFENIFYTEFHENPTNGLVFDTKPQRHGRTKMSAYKTHPVFSPFVRKV
jgi:hypothetical protein